MLLSIGTYAQRDSTKLFYGSYASSFNGKKYGFIEPNSRKVLIDYKYDKVMPFDYTYRGYASVSIGKQAYLLDTLGTEYPIAFRVENLTDETRVFIGVVTPEVCKFTKLQYVIDKYSSREKKPVNIPAEIANLKDLFHLQVSAKTLQSFPENIGELTKLKTLIVSSEIETFPVHICKITSLEKLEVSGEFKTIPEEIGDLTHLISLRINAKLTSLPSQFANLKNLKYLYCGSNKFEALPKAICSLSNLEEVSFYSNKITKLPHEIGNLTKLKILHLGYNKLETLPDEIGNLQALENLELKKNNIKTIPKTLGNLSNLKKLSFYKCKETDFVSICNAFENYGRPINIVNEAINSKESDSGELLISLYIKKTIPKEIGKLTSLKYLSVFSSIDKLPAEIGSLKKLEMLSMSNSYLEQLPIEIGDLENLKILNLQKAELTSLPKEIGKLKKLEILHLENNKITSLPAEMQNMTSLKELYLSNNELKTLPSGLSNLSNLTFLNVSRNKLPLVEICIAFKDFPKPFVIGRLSDKVVSFQLKIMSSKNTEIENVIPKEIGAMKNLVGLCTDYMSITSLPDEIGNLPLLEALDLSGNKMTQLPAGIEKLTSLKYLDVMANELTVIPEQAAYLKTLTHFNISGNKLTVLPTSLFKSKVLKRLDVSNNQITALPKTITKAKQLEHLVLSGNPISTINKKMYKLNNLSLLDISKCEKIDYISVFKALKKSKKDLSIGNYYQIEKYATANGLLVKTVFGDSIPSEISYLQKNLKNLSVNGSKVTTLPSEMVLLTSLETLTLSKSIKRDEKEKIKKMMHEKCVIN